jgi:hypothetical protein
MWEADNSFTLKLGHAPGVKVFFNGESIDVASGAAQDVNTIVFKEGVIIKVRNYAKSSSCSVRLSKEYC